MGHRGGGFLRTRWSFGFSPQKDVQACMALHFLYMPGMSPEESICRSALMVQGSTSQRDPDSWELTRNGIAFSVPCLPLSSTVAWMQGWSHVFNMVMIYNTLGVCLLTYCGLRRSLGLGAEVDERSPLALPCKSTPGL